MSSLSVVTVCYNSALFLEDNIRSVRMASTKYAIPVEHIFVVGCDTDGTREIIGKFPEDDFWHPVVVYRQDRGVSEAFNIGLFLAKNKFVQFLNSDDFLHHNADLSILKTSESLWLRFLAFRLDKGELIRSPRADMTLNGIFKTQIVSHPSNIYKTRFAQKFTYSQGLKYNMDVQWFIDILTSSISPREIMTELSVFRIHDGQLTNKKHARERYIEILFLLAKHKSLLHSLFLTRKRLFSLVRGYFR